MNVGWLCSRCGKVNSPYVQCCTCTQEKKAAIKKEEKQTEKDTKENEGYSTYYVKIQNESSLSNYIPYLFKVSAKNKMEAEGIAKEQAVKYFQNKNIPCGALAIVSVSKGMVYGGNV